MTQFEYKCVSIQADVSQADLANKKAGARVSAQVELQLNQLSREGYEYYRHLDVDVLVRSPKGCFASEAPADKNVTLITMIFRRPVR